MGAKVQAAMDTAVARILADLEQRGGLKGSDVANIVNSAVGITNFELTQSDEVYVSVTLPSVTVATIGGGTHQGTAHECLKLMGVAGKGGALKLAEIAAATLLAGEISMGAAIASGEFVIAHEHYGRNRPEPSGL